jgi:hypothetical protein
LAKVKTADLDDNPATADNVIVYEDVKAGKVKTIDRYYYIHCSNLEQQRTFYSYFLVKEKRKHVSHQEEKILRQYFTKYPTLQNQ